MSDFDDRFAEVVEGVVEQYVPGFRDMDDRRYRIVNVTHPQDGTLCFEVRDIRNGQAIVGRYRVTTSVERYG